MGKIWKHRPGKLCMTIGLLMMLFTVFWLASPVAAGDITGRVTNSSGAGIEGVYVAAYDVSGNWVAYCNSQPDGYYTISGLPAGSYKIEFDGRNAGYVHQWYSNKMSFDTATTVAVTVGSTTSGINAVLALGGTITGRVTNSAGSGIESVLVWVRDASGGWVNEVYTQSDGSYTITGLPTGSYKIEFDGRGAGYIKQWYSNKTSFETANAVSVTAGSTTSGINAVLALGGTIIGRVTNSSGTGIEGVGVAAYDDSESLVNAGYTQSDGSYSIRGLPTGSYKIEFYGQFEGYINQWYSNKTSYETANAVSVTAGSTTSGINAVLVLGGTITGRVTNSSGTGIEGVQVCAEDASENGRFCDQTQSDGIYTILGLKTGIYRVEFYGEWDGYITQWYSNKTSYDTANAVSVTAGSTTSGINAVLVLGGTISGRVTNSSGTGIEGVSVYVNDASEEWVKYSGYTQSDGNYSIIGLPTGSYKIEFYGENEGYINQWYSNKTSFDTANAVSVTAGSTTNGVNAVLALDGTITGRVTNASGAGVEGVWVGAYDASGGCVNSSSTQSDGSYTITGLPTGSYRIEFYGEWDGYITQWYSNKTSYDTANAVSVTAGSTTSGINAVLVLGGTITGRVTNASGAGVEGVVVGVVDAFYFGNHAGFSFTQTDGNYTVSGLPSGSYKIYFYDTSLGYAVQWYSNKTTFDTATVVPVTTGSTISGINAVLALGGTITGRVTNSSGAGIEGVLVWARDASGGWVNNGYTQADGSYTITSLPAGSYRIEFDGSQSGYATQWYSNKTSFGIAAAVPVTAGSTTGGINAVMALASGPILNLSFIGDGSGMVTSSPAGIATNTDATHEFDFGEVVTLSASSDQYSLFAGWTGACVGTEDCIVYMDKCNSVIATFNRNTANEARINSKYYTSIMGAYQAASSGNTIQIWGTDFSENFNFNLNKAVTLEGGYNAGYTNQSGYTTLTGPLTISKGALTVDSLVVK